MTDNKTYPPETSLSPPPPPPESDADRQVEFALWRLAVGYEYTGRDGKTHTVPPDPKAAIYWLENRIPERWGKRKPPAIPPAVQPELFILEEEKKL